MGRLLAGVVTSVGALYLSKAAVMIVDMHGGLAPVLMLLPLVLAATLVACADTTKRAWSYGLLVCGMTAWAITMAGFLVTPEQVTWLKSGAAEPADQKNANVFIAWLGFAVGSICMGFAGFLLLPYYRRTLRPSASTRVSPLMSGFADYYRNVIAGQLEQQVGQRWAIFRRKRRILLTAFPFWLLAAPLVVVAYAPGFPPVWFSTVWVVALVVILVELWSSSSKLQDYFQQILFQKISPFFGLSYRAAVTDLELGRFYGLGLVPDFDERTITHVLEGRHKGIQMVMAEAMLQAFKLRLKPYRPRQRRTVFHGILFLYTLPVSVRGRTMVLRDRGRLVNWLMDKKLWEQQVRFDDPAFEESFEVFTSNTNEARTLCSPAFREFAVALSRRLDKKARLQMGFDRDRLLISILPSGRPFGPVSLRGDMADPSWAWEFAEQVGLVLEVADSLDQAMTVPA